MKNLLLSATLFAAIGVNATMDQADLACYIFDDWNIYDLRTLEQQDIVDGNSNYHVASDSNTVTFNWC